MKHIVSFSGGKDSTALLLMMLEKGMQVDDIIFCDTGMEFPEMYNHIEKVEKHINRKITKVSFDFMYWFKNHERTKGKRQREKGYGWPSIFVRWCTREKVSAINKYIKSRYPNEEIIEYIGFAVDENRKIKNKGYKYPLIDWGIIEKQALEYCYSKGFDWERLYKIFNRVSCYCCPLQSLKELKKLYIHFPELWENMVDMDKYSEFPFRKDYSLQELSRRFYEKSLQGVLIW